jgi:hypothetical protein
MLEPACLAAVMNQRYARDQKLFSLPETRMHAFTLEVPIEDVPSAFQRMQTRQAFGTIAVGF